MEEQQILNDPASTRFDLLLHWSLRSLAARARDQWVKATKFGDPVLKSINDCKEDLC